MGLTPQLTIVVVLYRTDPASSAAFTSLERESGAKRRKYRLLIHDNTEDREQGPKSAPPGVHEYVCHPENPGLARPYNEALARAEQAGSEWLMLLDQDTVVTEEYLEEVLSLTQEPAHLPDSVAALLPNLRMGGRHLSPHRRMRVLTRPLTPPGVHTASGGYRFYNSGAVMRVSAIRAVGGFPEDYPLDHLDHAVAALLRSSGRSVLVLESTLDHHLSMVTAANMPISRLRSVLAAEERFHRQYGTAADRRWLALRRLVRLVLVTLRLRETPSRSAECKGFKRSVAGLGVRQRGRA